MSVINKMLHDLAKRQAEQPAAPKVEQPAQQQLQQQKAQQTEPRVNYSNQISRAVTAPSSSQPLTQEGLTRPLSTRRKWLLALSILIAVLLSYSALQGGADFSPLLTPTATTPVTSVAAEPAETSTALTTAPEAVLLVSSTLPAPETSVLVSSAPTSSETAALVSSTLTVDLAAPSTEPRTEPNTEPSTEPLTELLTELLTEPSTELNTQESIEQRHTAVPTTTSEADITATVMPAESDVPELSEPELPASSSSSTLASFSTSSSSATLASSSAPQSVSHLAKTVAEIVPASSTNTLAEPNPASANAPAQLQIETLPQQKWAQQMAQAATAISQQRWEEALYLLETDAAVADYPPLFALKAAVLQQVQQWSAALALYQQLLLIEPQQASWNLSAGIAAQQLQQTALANQYFQVAWQGRQQLSQASQQFLQQQLNPMN